MEKRDVLFWIWLSEALGAGNRDVHRLICLYDTPYDLFHADDAELEGIDGISPKTRNALCDKSLANASRIMDLCQRLEIGVLPYGDPAYPNALKDLPDPPVLLYYRGKLPDWNHLLSIGMVGTRKMSLYGLRTAYRISYELASAGAIIVSGMAAGIDGVCAAAALAANAPTVAVLGCGVDVLYPRHHGKLMSEIEQNGVVLSEYAPGTLPVHYHFPVRNRIISGISQGTVVVEAGIGSGSLITAKNAILQGRDVFAFPANVGSRGSEGTNGLLRDGANLVLDCNDVLSPYRFVYSNSLDFTRLSEAQKHSEADLHYLHRVGVIELTEDSEKNRSAESSQNAPEKTESAPAPAKKRSGRQTRTTPAEPCRRADKQPVRTAQRDADEGQSSAERQEERGSIPTSTTSGMTLTPVQTAILEAMPLDRAVSADLFTQIGHPYGDVIAALTMLEILGLIQKLPGAMYIKS